MMERLVARAEKLVLGHGLDDAPLGPLVSDEQLKRVSGFVADAKKRGVTVATGGKPATVAGMEGGYFFAPTIFDDVKPADEAAQEEIFGPVLTVQIVDSPEEAVAIGNSTCYGLVAGIYTADISKALRFARDIDAGQVFINQYFAGGVATPFGGVKHSGFGREKGLAALTSYFRIKCVTAKI
jgi:acyl-CoA reductase-like NAD-dependent aldehyde dehydrogenase